MILQEGVLEPHERENGAGSIAAGNICQVCPLVRDRNTLATESTTPEALATPKGTIDRIFETPYHISSDT